MQRRTLLKTSVGTALALFLAQKAGAQDMDAPSQASFDTVRTFMGAMGAGDMDAMSDLMADDMVWHNEGDATLPWTGEASGKEAIFAFLGVFSSSLQTTLWENEDAFASGDTVAVFGRMNATATKSGQPTGLPCAPRYVTDKLSCGTGSKTALPIAKPITVGCDTGSPTHVNARGERGTRT